MLKSFTRKKPVDIQRPARDSDSVKEDEMSPKTKESKKRQTLQEELFPADEWAWLDQLIEDMADGGDETRRLPQIDAEIDFKIPIVKRQPSAKVTRCFME